MNTTAVGKENQAPTPGLSVAERKQRQAEYGKVHAIKKKKEQQEQAQLMSELTAYKQKARVRIEELTLQLEKRENAPQTPLGRVADDSPVGTPALLALVKMTAKSADALTRRLAELTLEHEELQREHREVKSGQQEVEKELIGVDQELMELQNRLGMADQNATEAAATIEALRQHIKEEEVMLVCA